MVFGCSDRSSPAERTIGPNDGPTEGLIQGPTFSVTVTIDSTTLAPIGKWIARAVARDILGRFAHR